MLALQLLEYNYKNSFGCTHVSGSMVSAAAVWAFSQLST
jgi:hypothetical protein